MGLSAEHEREFVAFVSAQAGALLRTACLLAGGREAGQDLLQLVLLKVALRWPRLRDEQRAVLVLRHYVDLSESDTAAELGVSVGTVKSTSSRALAALRAALPDREELA